MHRSDPDLAPADPHLPPEEEARAESAHNDYVAQPHDAETEGPVAEAETIAERISTDEAPMGHIGKRFNWRAPFFVGFAATAGVALMYGLVQLLVLAGSVLLLIFLALFLAIGMEPAVSFLVRHGLKRWLGVLVVLVLILGVLGGFLAAAIPAIVTQGEQLFTNAPTYLQKITDHSTWIGKLNDKYQLVAKLQTAVSSSSSNIVGSLLGAGVVVFTGVADSVIVLVLTAYFLADFPRLRALMYRFMPNSRRPRAILIGDDILAKVGGYVLGNLIISVIAGVLTFIWLIIFGVPYALLLAIMVALLDLVPVVGSTIAGVVVALVALSVSLPVCLATIGFFVVYRFLEDYFLVPRIIGKAVEVPALLTVVAVLLGAALLGVIGALVAIPAAAALALLTREVLFPRLDDA